MDEIESFFLWLNRSQGINLSIFYDAFDRSRLLRGALTTISLSCICLVLSIVIGIIGAWLQGSRARLVRSVVQVYIQFFRNTPPLVQLFFFYFALGGILPMVRDAYGEDVPLISNFGWAVISFSFFAGAFNVEIFRAGIEAVPRTTVEAAEALGYSRLKAYMWIILPLAFRVCLPALNNNLVNLVKTTTLAYAIGVPELFYASAQIWSEVLNVQEMMNVLLVAFVVIVGAVVWLVARLERLLRIPGYHA